MKVLISADMEGTCGVVDWVQVSPPWSAGANAAPSEYETARRQMTAEVAAAVRGAYAAGAELVTVNESHNGMKNLIAADLPIEARLITGHHKSLSMVQGVDEEGVGALIYTGYHGRAGTPNSVLAHTYTGFIRDVRLDGASTGEYGMNAATAGHFNVPVIMVTGGDICIKQVKDYLGEGIVGAEVKKELGTMAANHVHPQRACEIIEEAAREAVSRASEYQPFRIRPGCRVEVDVDHQERTDVAALAEDIERIGETTIAFNARDGAHLMYVWRSMLNRMMTPFAV
jgi:D-amino peptidase